MILLSTVWETKVLYFLDAYIKEWLSGDWERHSWLVGDTCTSQRDRERIHNYRSFLINAPKGGQGPIFWYWLEQTVSSAGIVMFSQADIFMGEWGHPGVFLALMLLEAMLEFCHPLGQRFLCAKISAILISLYYTNSKWKKIEFSNRKWILSIWHLKKWRQYAFLNWTIRVPRIGLVPKPTLNTSICPSQVCALVSN